MYHFISGYTAKVAGTEMGIVEPVSTFSACFGEAFLPRHPYLYAKMLAEKVEKYESNVWLVNTGWSGGKYGVGKRMSLKITRSILDSIHSGELEKAQYETVPGFNLRIPKSCTGVDSKILNPINTWGDSSEFRNTSKKLASQFVKNMDKYLDNTPKDVVEQGGPRLQDFDIE
uniref:Phosphoenolpyruvate carboxykinase n=1 Tax=Strombidium rassoulzadegani TaxID=1082188 RepID=A0A7S3CQQ5_9SPIT|mmetsp:Transcript_1998/g.3538  ORF Transcript_1998/g.3538 Transcript_1998/m.3538 type:complete len:172 (+) Transcript_1998:1281-1796(+)